MSAPAATTPLRVGAFTAACLLVSNAVGSGIFTTTGFMARDLGEPILILGLWFVGGVLALTGAISYSELGSALPRVGGEYVYIRRAYGNLPAFLSGWTSFTLGFGAAIAAAAVGFAHYLGALLPEETQTVLSPRVSALLLVWVLTGIHLLGVEQGGRLQRWLTIAKIGGIVALVIAGIGFGQGSFDHLEAPAQQPAAGVATALVSLIFVIYAYSGWNAAGYIAGEIRDPGRNLPRAMIGGTLFILGLYLAVNLFYFYALPVEVLAEAPVLLVAEKAASAALGPETAGLVVAVLCVSIAGATSSMIWAGPRVYFAMAQDGALPSFMKKTGAAGAPTTATLLQSAWISVLIFTGTFEELVVYSGVALALFGALAVGAVIVLRIREPDLERPYRVPLFPAVPLVFIATSLAIAGYTALEKPVEAAAAGVTVAVGIPFYFLARRRPTT